VTGRALIVICLFFIMLALFNISSELSRITAALVRMAP
jgi:hypothetical protein